ncbi:YhgE/Pip family protein [Luteococcus sp. OSA5]|uniref:YhgE/Pip domain-containing protein n=1 Tax=Luteococcus sp. OSA5 TaxID=3401630 RepID=UPI003B42EC10
MNIPIFHAERANSHVPLRRWSLLALVLVPVLVAGVLLGTAWGRDDRLGKITAAVVNTDEAVKVDGQTVPMGRQLAAEIVAKPSKNVTWKLSDPSDAAAGLASGEYAVVVTIPKNFSAAATSVADAKTAQQATIDVQTSPSSAVQDAQIAREVAEMAAQSTNAMLTGNYLDNIYVGFNTMGKQITTIGDGASQLADGAERLGDGTVKAAQGVGELGKGMNELDANGAKLDEGGSQLASGAQELGTGVAEYTKGTGQVVDGIGQLAGGINQLESGLEQSSGTGQFAQLGQLKQGAQQLSDGASGVSQGVDAYQQQLVAWRDGKAPVPPQVMEAYTEQFGEGCATQVADAMRTQLGEEQIAQYQAELKQAVATQLDELPAEMELTPEQKAEVLKRIQLPAAEQISEVLTDPKRTSQVAEAVCPEVEKLAEPAFTGGFRAGAGTAAAALDHKDPQTGQSLRSGTKSLATGANQLSGGVTQLVDELPKQIEAQLGQLKSGVKELSDGADTLASKSQQLKSGGTQLTDGANKLSTGLDEYTKGVGQYTDGVHQANQGVQELATGMTDLATGSTKLSEGTRTFAEKVSDGAKEVPSYSKQEREKLSGVVATPVSGDAERFATPLSQLTSLLLVLGAWLGALATWLLMRPIASRTLTSSRPSWQLAAATMVPGATVAVGQAVLLGILGSTVLDLGLSNGVVLTAFLMLTTLSFTAINHALAAWFGGLGRAVAVLLGAVAAAVGIVSAVPGVFTAIHGVSPLAPALDGVRRAVIGESLGVGPVGTLVGLWLLAAIACLLAVVRRRRLSPARYRRAAGRTGD